MSKMCWNDVETRQAHMREELDIRGVTDASSEGCQRIAQPPLWRPVRGAAAFIPDMAQKRAAPSRDSWLNSASYSQVSCKRTK